MFWTLLRALKITGWLEFKVVATIRYKDTLISLSDSSSDDEFSDITHGRSSAAPRSHHHHEEKKVTNSGTLLHILKANVSTGLLAMPRALSHFGLLAGTIGIFILGSMYIYCIHLLLDVNRAVVRRVMLDRKVQEIKQTIIKLLKAGRRAERRKKFNQVVEDHASAAQETSTKSKNWKEEYAADIEVGESSNSKKEVSKKKSKNWKEEYAADLEVGESSYSKQEVSKKKYTKMKPGSHDRYQPITGGKKKNRNKGKPSTSKQEDPDEIIVLEESDVQSSEAEESSASNQENSKKDTPEQENEQGSQEKENEQGTQEKENEQDTPEQENGQNTQEQDKQNDKDAEIKFAEAEAVILRTLDYPKLVQLSFHYGMPGTKSSARFFKFYVQMLMLLTHVGCCCVCFLFLAETLGEIATDGKFIFHYNSFQMVAYAVPIMICLSFIPDRHELTGVTMVAFLLQLCGVLMMLYFFFQGEHSDDLHLYIAPPETWYLYFGFVFYAFEGTGVTLHLESHMEKKQDFRGWNGILNKSMFFIIPLYIVFGALGYWKFGNDVKASVTFNLPEERITDLIQFMTALGILLTYPFHLSFVLTPIKKLFIQDDFSDTTKNVLDLTIRGAFVVFTFVMSALVPYLELQLTVLGATAGCFLVLVVPPFMSLNSYYYLPDLKYSNFRLLLHCFIMLVGFAGTALGSYMTIKNLPLYYPNATIFG